MDSLEYFNSRGYTFDEIYMCMKEIHKKYGKRKAEEFVNSGWMKNAVDNLGDVSLIPIIRSIYHKGYEFPKWTERTIRDRPDLKLLVTVYYDTNDDLSTVRKLCINREPVNMVDNNIRSRPYNLDSLGKEFGWRISLYQTIWDTKRNIGPNIAIYCKTPVIDSYGTKYPDAHIINSVGAALDSKDGPDYKHFIKGAVNINRTMHALREFYETVFKFIFVCAEDKQLKTVCMSLVGANNFAREYPGGIESFQDEVWIPTFRKIRNLYKKINVIFMGTDDYFRRRLQGKSKVKYDDTGKFPQLLRKIDVNNTLIVNAWDPFSFVGNGNERDNSLDGYIGRVTACSMLCWPLVNSEMRYLPVRISD